MSKGKYSFTIKFILLAVFVVFAITGQAWAQQGTDHNSILYLFDEINEITAEKDHAQFSIQSTEPGIVRDYAATAERIGIAEISGTAASPGALSGQDALMINVFEDKSYRVLIDSVNAASDSYSLRGSVEGSTFGLFTMSTVQGQTMAVLRLPEENKLYNLVYSPKIEAYYLFETFLDRVDQQRVHRPPQEAIPAPDQLDHYKTSAQEQPARLNFLQDLQVSGNPNQPAVVDLMIVYTPAARNWAGGEAGMINQINSALNFANEALANSNTGITLRLVHHALVSYTESGNIVTDLNRLRNPGDGHMDIIHTWRNQHNADLVALFSDSGNPNRWGGLGALFLRNNPDQFNAENAAFSVSNVQGVGRSYLAIHEWGHNFGAHHHRQQNSEPGPNRSFGEYAAGWRFQVGSNWYNTIMSYNQGDEFGPGTPGAGITSTEVGCFSNPNVTYQGVPTGNATYGDNARVLRESKHIIAAYRNGTEPPPPETGSLRIYIEPAEARSAGAQWRLTSGPDQGWKNSGAIISNLPTGTYTITFKDIPGWNKPANTPVTIIADQMISGTITYTQIPPPTSSNTIFLQHADSRVAALYLEGTTLTGESSLGSSGPGWRIKAVVDMNNNGREDLVFQHVDGWLRVLYMQDNAPPEEAPIRNPGSGQEWINPVWDLKAVYDLNRNGSPDLIWQRNDGELAIWFMNGLQAVNTGRLTQGGGLATIDPSWQLRAVHDLLGDGKPEVLWQNVSGKNRGELAYWVLDGFERSGGGRLTHLGGRATIDPAWTMRAVHDLLGDGKPEIIWQHNDGRVSYWAMQGSTRAGGGSLFRLNDTRWKIVGCGN